MMRGKKLLLLLVLGFMLSLIFLNSWQGYRYERLSAEIRRMEEEQKDWLEKNKQLLAGLAVFSSPARIETLAERTLGLAKIDSSRLIKVVVGKGRDQVE